MAPSPIISRSVPPEPTSEANGLCTMALVRTVRDVRGDATPAPSLCCAPTGLVSPSRGSVAVAMNCTRDCLKCSPKV
eukprot:2379693-Karenia_brevis.AAC.1